MEISHALAQYPGDFIKMESELETMWDSHLGRVTAAERESKLSYSNKRVIHLAQHWAGLKVCKFEKNNISKVTSRESSKWLKPSLHLQWHLYPKRLARFDFAWTTKINAVEVRDC